MAKPLQQFNEVEIYNQFARGMTINQLGAMYKVRPLQISSIVKKYTTVKRGYNRDKLYDYIYEDYCNGIVNTNMLSRKHNVSLQVVRKALRLHGEYQRPSFTPDYERAKRIATALANGIPQCEIARNEGVSRQLVNAIAKKLK